jgi:GGDEF domain-containing protein
MNAKKYIVLLEVVVLALIIGAVNLFFTDDPGFASLYYIPYLLASVLISAIYGAGWGFFCFCMTAAVIAGALPLSFYLITDDWTVSNYWRNLISSAYIPAAVGLICVYVFGVIRTTSRTQIAGLRKRMQELARENWLIKQKSDALFRANRELDERVSRQQEAITSLHTQLRKLDTLDVGQALDVLLETVQIFTRAVKASVWRYDESSNELRLAASRGWEADENIETSIPVDGTIEGWVYRNNSLFSIRMLLQYDNLSKMDTGRNIITIPLSLSQRVWGVLNIQEMPFEKYNFNSERILQIIASLAEHSIEQAVAYESIIKHEEIDDITGLPLFSQFFRMLEEEVKRTGMQKGTFSIIIMELTNYARLAEEWGLDETKGLVKQIAAELENISDRKAHCFEYKEDSQIALIIPGLDIDGVSLFSLESLEKINTGDWRINGEPAPIEAAIGFSVFSGGGETADQLLEQAENLLEMQKV